MAKFNKEAINKKFLHDSKTMEECGMYLQSLLSKRMSREILFRGKHVHALSQNNHLDGMWIEGYLSDKNYINLPELDGEFLVDPETVCQYTGLTDKNGRKIFEWDIVKTSQYGVDDGNGHNHAGFDTFVVVFSDGGFCLENKWRRFNFQPSSNFEVIGNIFDNPELLKERRR